MSNEPKPVRVAGHQPGLDGVRGVAILLVMALHFVGNATPTSLAERIAVKASGYGLLGVDLFFVLSGFLITGLLLDAKGAPRYFRNFYARRTVRIFPLYYAVLALLFLGLPLVVALPPPLEEARRHQAWLWTYTANWYVAARSSWEALSYASHFWSLAIEEHFYLVWPVVVFLVRREALERICAGVVVAGLALRISLALLGVSELSISVLTPCRVDALCVGGLLAAVARRSGGAEPLLRRAVPSAIWAGAAILGVSAWCAATKLGLPVLHQLRTTLYALFFGALTLASVLPAERSVLGRAFRSSTLRMFGKYSYGLYVYHGLISYHMVETRTEERLTALLGSHAAAMLARAAIGVAASLLVSVASYELLEKPFLALKRFFEPARTGHAPVATAIFPTSAMAGPTVKTEVNVPRPMSP